jgi:glycosyltransferase involved in cell wall biosynthesis
VKNRIAIIAGYAPSLVNFRGPLLKTIEQLEVDLLLIAPALRIDILSPLELKNCQVLDLPLERNGVNPFKDLATLYSLWQSLRKFKPDLVLAYTAKPVIYGVLAAYMARVPKRYGLITGLGSAFTSGSCTPGYVTWVMSQLYRLALRFTTGVILQNPDDEQLLREKNILPGWVPSFIVNGSGVDTEFFGLSNLPSEPVFLLMARLIVDKGIREYVSAAQIIKSKYPGVRFLLAGFIDSNPTSITYNELQSWIDNGDIEYLGNLADVRPAIKQASIYVFPSFYREGTPRSVLEAMAMGRPVITTDAPGCRETVLQGINGYLVPTRDSVALADSMEKLITSPELRRTFGLASRSIAEQKYDVRKVNKRMLEIMGLL